MPPPDDAGGGAPHRIRLRGPWEMAWLGPTGAAGRFERFHFPGSWPSSGQAGRAAVVRRRFARPANLDDTERILLVCQPLPAGATARLNGAPLDLSGVWDVTGRLLPRNVLEIELAAGAAAEPILPGEVRLDIHGAAN